MARVTLILSPSWSAPSAFNSRLGSGNREEHQTPSGGCTRSATALRKSMLEGLNAAK